MIAFWFVFWLTISAAVLLIAKVLIAKKATGELGLREMNISMKFTGILKSLIVAAYAMLTMTERLFNQDFCLRQMQFTEMKIEHWLVALPYMVIFTVFFTGPCDQPRRPYRLFRARGNDLNHSDQFPWGMVAVLVVYVMSHVSWTGAPISDFTLSFSMMLFVPVTVFISRKVYKMTNSTWLGAFINAMLLAWTMACSSGIADQYFGQNIISIIFGV